jgi:hypothetical protein
MKLGNIGYPYQNSLVCPLLAFATLKKKKGGETVLCTMDFVNSFTLIRPLI